MSKGFQMYCLDNIYKLGLTREILKNRTRGEYENIQRRSSNLKPWTGYPFKNTYFNMYSFDKTFKKLENNGSLHLIKPIYDQFC
eukprot:gene9699-1904_t